MLTVAGVITLITMIVGVVGNSLTIVALVRHSKIRTVAAAFIARLVFPFLQLSNKKGNSYTILRLDFVLYCN